MGRRREPAGFSNRVLDRDALAQLARELPLAAEPRPASRVVLARPPDPRDDAALWADAVRGATPMALLRGGDLRVLPARPCPPAPGPARDPDAETAEALGRFVRGEGVFDIADQDEFVEGSWRGLDPRVLQRLRGGEFSIQAWVDLHGLVVDEGQAALHGFIRASRLRGRRCVLVVHGRGRHSKDRIPVLKERVVHWLSRGRLAREVLAFCTARPRDGGAGALYVLLRRGGEQRPGRRD